MKDLMGQIFAGKYLMDTFLGNVGMVEVYKVWDNHRMTYLAIKPLLEEKKYH